MPVRLRPLALLAALALLSATRADAQRPPIAPGDLVRLHRLTPLGDTESVVARWRSASRDSVIVARGSEGDSTVRAYARSMLAGVDVQRGGEAEDAAIVTFGLAGGIATAVAVVKWCADDPRACEPPPRADCDTTTQWSLPALLVVGGIVVGGLIGEAIAPHRHWEPVILPTQLGTNPDGGMRWQMLVGVRLPLGRRRYD